MPRIKRRFLEHRRRVRKALQPHRWSVDKQLPGEPMMTLKFGKYSGLTLDAIADQPDGMSYLEWLAHRAIPRQYGVTVQVQTWARRAYYRLCAKRGEEKRLNSRPIENDQAPLKIHRGDRRVKATGEAASL